MGCHFVPRYLLEGFASNSMIWQYERKSGKHQKLHLKRVAQSRKFYSESFEKELNERFEIPANVVIKKLRNGLTISWQEKEYLLKYIHVLYKRTKVSRERITKRMPEIIEEEKVEWSNVFDGLVKSISEKNEEIAPR